MCVAVSAVSLVVSMPRLFCCSSFSDFSDTRWIVCKNWWAPLVTRWRDLAAAFCHFALKPGRRDFQPPVISAGLGVLEVWFCDFVHFLNFLLRSLLSKQAEGLKEIEKDAWQQNVLRHRLRSSWPSVTDPRIPLDQASCWLLKLVLFHPNIVNIVMQIMPIYSHPLQAIVIDEDIFQLVVHAWHCEYVFPSLLEKSDSRKPSPFIARTNSWSPD